MFFLSTLEWNSSHGRYVPAGFSSMLSTGTPPLEQWEEDVLKLPCPQSTPGVSWRGTVRALEQLLKVEMPPIQFLDPIIDHARERLRVAQEMVKTEASGGGSSSSSAASASSIIAAAARTFVGDGSTQLKRKTCGIEVDRGTPFDLPLASFPIYGGRRVVRQGDKFAATFGGCLVQRGAIHLSRDDVAMSGITYGWLNAIFLAQDAKKGSFVFKYDGAKRRRCQIAANEQFTTHLLQVGKYFYDASDTRRYPNGLLNMNPGGPNSCCWGRLNNVYQRNAVSVSAQNVFLQDDFPNGALLTIDYGKKSYVTKGFLRLALEPATVATQAQSAAELARQRSCATGGRVEAVPRARRGRNALKRARPDACAELSVKQQRIADKAARAKKQKREKQRAIDADAALARELQRELGGMRSRRTARPT